MRLEERAEPEQALSRSAVEKKHPRVSCMLKAKSIRLNAQCPPVLFAGRPVEGNGHKPRANNALAHHGRLQDVASVVDSSKVDLEEVIPVVHQGDLQNK